VGAIGWKQLLGCSDLNKQSLGSPSATTAMVRTKDTAGNRIIGRATHVDLTALSAAAGYPPSVTAASSSLGLQQLAAARLSSSNKAEASTGENVSPFV
jgi:hypothetical protein